MALTQSEIFVENGHVGPHPSYIQLAKPYIFEQKLQECMAATGVTEAKEDNIRLQGVAWIDSLRKALHLYDMLDRYLYSLAKRFRPVRTFNTACVYYHRFRLVHVDTEYGFMVGSVGSNL